MRRLLITIFALGALVVPAAAHAAAPAPTDVKLEIANNSVKVAWSGAAGQHWIIYLVGQKMQWTTSASTTRKSVSMLDSLTDPGQSLTAYVAQCDQPTADDARVFDATLGLLDPALAYSVSVACTTEGLGTWAASTTIQRLKPPTIDLTPWSGPKKIGWRVTTDGVTAPVTGYTLRYRPDRCTNETSGPPPVGCRPARWRVVQLKPNVRSYKIPGIGHDTYWQVEVLARSAVGSSTAASLGMYAP